MSCRKEESTLQTRLTIQEKNRKRGDDVELRSGEDV